MIQFSDHVNLRQDMSMLTARVVFKLRMAQLLPYLTKLPKIMNLYPNVLIKILTI